MDRSTKAYGIDWYKTRLPGSSVVVSGILAASMWALFVYDYFRRGQVQEFALIVATLFNLVFVVVYAYGRRFGIKF